jgi:hypothetical protein
MPIEINTFALGDLDAAGKLRTAIKIVFEGRNGDWHVSIIGNQNNRIWQVKVDGPEDYIWTNDFQEHDANLIAGTIEKALPCVTEW